MNVATPPDATPLDTVLVATDDATVLVAEDDKFDQLILRRAFRAAQLRARVEFVEHGEKLLTYIEGADQALRPRLVFLDLNMPVLDGWAVLRQMRANPETADVPVIVMSTLTAPEDIERVMAAGATRYFAKPVRFEDLVAVIKDCTQPWLG